MIRAEKSGKSRFWEEDKGSPKSIIYIVAQEKEASRLIKLIGSIHHLSNS